MPEPDAVFVALAEVMWVPCPPECGGPQDDYHIDCSGTGKKWLLREPCDPKMLVGGRSGGGAIHPYGEIDCLKCAGRGWTPANSFRELTAAARAKGWDIFIDASWEDEGDEVQISAGYVILSMVTTSSGLRDELALATAMLRAAEKKRA